ncbi:hypothetical protein QWY31_03105 [Cytophagales bacterium LB-30]|uniref:DUF2157 domain-containing protein n=1 Tax=Shiella aurantiaca TaxID=3058365 RepID=A0ABT8F2K6_9BACT|nr:hypothetical protein [Shiella aurantiaca]MDN4164471.1 hypothetical protein [Shiella aurantiaca]
MIAYDKNRLTHYFMRQQIKSFSSSGLWSAQEEGKWKEGLQPHYMPTPLFLRIGIFILTLLVLSFSMGFFGALFFEVLGDDDSIGILLALGGLASLLMAKKYAIESRNQFATGMDDAFIYTGLSLFCIGVLVHFQQDSDWSSANIALFLSICSGVVAYYFVDRLLTVFTVLGLAAYVFFTLTQLGSSFLAFIPFLIGGYAGLVLYGYKKIKDLPQGYCWASCLQWGNYTAMLLLYASLQYYLLMELHIQLALADGNTPGPLPFAYVFLAITFLLPLAYMVYGYRKKLPHWLYIGFLLEVISLICLHYYAAPWELYWSLIGGGVILIAIGYGVWRYFAQERNGFVVKEEEKTLNANIEMGANMEQMPERPSNTGFEFGGGHMGGGGSGGDF